MADFKITVGMSTQSILQNLDSIPNLNNKNKQLIINFCNNDKDKKVTNEIELAMLDSYTNNGEKVSMPKPDGMKNITGTKEAESYPAWSNNKTIYRANKNRILGFSKDNNGWTRAFSSFAFGKKLDTLIDEDNDGYADWRLSIESDNVDLYDDNLDGIYDRKITQKELNVQGFEFVDIYTEMDLKTNTVKSKTKISHKTVEDKNGKGQTEIFSETDMLTGEVKTTKMHIDYETGKTTEINE